MWTFSFVAKIVWCCDRRRRCQSRMEYECCVIVCMYVYVYTVCYTRNTKERKEMREQSKRKELGKEMQRVFRLRVHVRTPFLTGDSILNVIIFLTMTRNEILAMSKRN